MDRCERDRSRVHIQDREVKNLSADYTDYADSLKEWKSFTPFRKRNLRNLCNLRINSFCTACKLEHLAHVNVIGRSVAESQRVSSALLRRFDRVSA